MNANRSSSSGFGAMSQTTEVEALQDTAPNYAEAVREAYDKLPEASDSIPEQIVAFVSDAGKRLMKTFEEGSPLKKAVLLAGGALTAYLSYKGIKKLAEVIRQGFDGIFGLGDRLKQGLESTKEQTVKRILQIALGGTLSAGAIGTLYEALKDKINLTDFTRAWATGGVPEIGSMLLSTAMQGIERIPHDLWAKVAPALGWPAWEQVSGSFGAAAATVFGHQTAEMVGSAAEVGAQTLADFSERMGLKDLHQKAMSYFNSDPRFRDWQSRPEMVWVQDLGNPQKVADALGVDLKKPETWQTALTIGGGALGLGAGYLTLRRLIGKRGAGLVTVNLALYAFLKSEKVDRMVLNGLETFKQFEIEVCRSAHEKIKVLLERYYLEPKDLGLKFDPETGLGLAEMLEAAWELGQDHPFLAATGLNLGMRLFAYVSKKVLSLAIDLAKLTPAAMKWALLDHKTAAAALAALGVVSVVKRRDILYNFADLFYGKTETPARKAFLEFMAKLTFVDLAAQESFAERTLDPFYERLIADPLEFLGTAEFKMRLFKDLGDGKVLFKMDPGLSGFAFGIVQHGTPVWHALNFEFGVFESLMMEFSRLGNPDNDFNILAATTLGAEGYIFGKMMKGAIKGHVSLLDDLYADDRIWHFIKSFIPLTKANRHVWFSALREGGDSLPYVKLTTIKHAFWVKEMSYNAQGLSEAASRGDLSKVQKYDEQIARLYDKLGGKEGFTFYKDIDLRFELKTLRGRCDAIRRAMENPPVGHRGGLYIPRNEIDSLNGYLRHVETRFSRFLKMAEFAKELEFKKLFQEISQGGFEVSRLEVDALLKNKTKPELCARAAELQSSIAGLADEDPLKAFHLRELATLEAHLEPDRILSSFSVDFEGLSPADKAIRLEQTAGRLQGVEHGISSQVNQRIESILTDAQRRGLSLNSEAVQNQLKVIDETLVQPFWQLKKIHLEKMNAAYRSLPKSMRTTRLISHMELLHENSLLTRVVKGAKGRGVLAAIMLPVMFGVDVLLARDDAEKSFWAMLEEFGPQGRQMLLDICPVAGTLSALHSAAYGQEYVTGRKLEGWERHINWLWAGVGALADTAAVLTLVPSGSTSLAANGAARLALAASRGSSVARRLQQSWPRVAALADRMGGWEELVQSVYRFQSRTDAVRRGAARGAMAGSIAGTAAVVGGVSANLIYEVKDGDPGFDLPEELKAASQTAPETSGKPHLSMVPKPKVQPPVQSHFNLSSLRAAA